MKLTHIPLLAGTLASAFSFNTFAGDLVSVQFSNSFYWDTHLFDSALPLFLTEREIAGGCHDHCPFPSNQSARYALLPRGQSLCATGLLVRRRCPFRPELRAQAPMGGRQAGAVVTAVCHRCLCLRGDEQSLSSGAQG
ncbi:hypothetical protein D3C85_905990 [compost metagenome]